MVEGQERDSPSGTLEIFKRIIPLFQLVYATYYLKKRSLELGAEKFLIKGEYLPKELFKITEKIIKRK